MIALLCALAVQAPASLPASLPGAPSATVDLKIRVIHGHNKSTSLDPKINDLFGLLKSLAFQAYELKEETSVKIISDGDGAMHKGPTGRQLQITAKSYKLKKGRGEVRIELEIPEAKFKTKATIQAGATLVVGGPKFDDGVIFFALTATTIQPKS